MALLSAKLSWLLRGIAIPCTFAGLAALGSAAQAGDGKTLAVELNALAQTGEACRLTFVSTNGLGTDLEGVSLEIVVFDSDAIVRHLTIFDFGALPAGKPRVRQFELPKTECGRIGRVLVYGVAACSGEGLAEAACEDALSLENRTGIEFSG